MPGTLGEAAPAHGLLSQRAMLGAFMLSMTLLGAEERGIHLVAPMSERLLIYRDDGGLLSPPDLFICATPCDVRVTQKVEKLLVANLNGSTRGTALVPGSATEVQLALVEPPRWLIYGVLAAAGVVVIGLGHSVTAQALNAADYGYPTDIVSGAIGGTGLLVAAGFGLVYWLWNRVALTARGSEP